MTVVVGEKKLTIEDVVRVARRGEQVELSVAAVERIRKCRGMLRTKVAARDHNHIGGINDLFYSIECLGTFYLGDDAALPPCLTQQLPGYVHIVGRTHERHRDIIGLQTRRKADIFFVLFRERRC